MIEFKDYFMQFGETEDVIIMQDKGTNKSRGFGFVTYNSLDSVDKVIKLNGTH